MKKIIDYYLMWVKFKSKLNWNYDQEYHRTNFLEEKKMKYAVSQFSSESRNVQTYKVKVNKGNVARVYWLRTKFTSPKGDLKWLDRDGLNILYVANINLK